MQQALIGREFSFSGDEPGELAKNPLLLDSLVMDGIAE